MVNRLIITIIFLPLGIAAIATGGWVYTAVIAILLALAAWEYVNLSQALGLKPSRELGVAGVVFLVLARAWSGFEDSAMILSALILASLVYHLVEYERGRDLAVQDFGATLGCFLYLGWIGAYLISLRNMPEGKWWVLLILPSVWLADSGAYLLGTRFGKHKLAPRLSPKKTWEGYLGGIVFGTLFTILLAVAWQMGAGAGSSITPLRGAWIGLAMGVLPTLGDLGESLFKRTAGVKDSSNLIPGHGGFFDRVDSWIWAGVIGFYLVAWLGV